jgi:hypothetical protein
MSLRREHLTRRADCSAWSKMLQGTLLRAVFSVTVASGCPNLFKGFQEPHDARTRQAFTAWWMTKVGTETKRLGLTLMKWNGPAGTRLLSPALRASPWDSHCFRTHSGFRVGRRPFATPAPSSTGALRSILLHREQRA